LKTALGIHVVLPASGMSRYSHSWIWTCRLARWINKHTPWSCVPVIGGLRFVLWWQPINWASLTSGSIHTVSLYIV